MKEREKSIDYLRVTAMLMVIVLHISASYVEQRNSIYDLNYIFANIIQSFTRICVPLFIIITGKYIFKKRITNYKDFYKKISKKIIIPFLIWVLLYSIFSGVLMYKNSILDIKTLFVNIATGRAYYHLWYIYMIIPFYMLVPFLRFDYSKKTKKILIIIGLSFGIFHNISNYFFFRVNLFWIFWWLDYLGLFFLGDYLSKDNNSSKKSMIGYIIFSLILSMLSYFTLNNYNVNYWYSYTNPIVILNSFYLYKFFLNLEIRKNNLDIFVKKLSQQSYGIYLAHALVLEIMRYFKIIGIFNNLFIDILFSSLICVVFSYGISILIDKSIKLFGR